MSQELWNAINDSGGFGKKSSIFYRKQISANFFFFFLAAILNAVMVVSQIEVK